MAKIYSSRIMLDPQLISLANNALYNRIKDDREARKGLFDSFSNLGNTMGKFGDTMYERYLQGKRRDSVMGSATADQAKDPVFLAAVDEYARTGSSSPLSTYQLGVNTAAERAAAAQRNQDETDARNRREKFLAEEDAKVKYGNTLKEMLEYDDPNSEKYSPTMAESCLQELKALESRYGKDTFSKSAEDMRKAVAAERAGKAAKAEQEAEEARRLAFEENQDKKEAEAKAKQSIKTRNWVMNNVMPVGAVQPEKNEKGKVTKTAAEVRGEIDAFINNLPDLLDSDKKMLLDRLYGTKTTDEQTSEAVRGAINQNTGKQTTEKLAKQQADLAVLEKARKKIKDGKRNRLTTKEIEALKAAGEF